ncbi:GNAT family N-acetyltransferase [Algoriphagus sp. NG3]|uniref:GNAT family N-acetyltransferase n=1 Tax=unclassified Algoriphagus TaxID=2641541 RepID=UPI002A8326A0|nr:GNAT family N-acetyltransferase [Algoriphagus sp. NG3]WPR76496.1 GNAT family N-acetyltransferase [Algoriphagus sp. NG3]
MNEIKIQHEFDGKKGSFYLEVGSKRSAEMVYVMAGPDKMIIEHTEVDESLKGQGIGGKLLEELVAYVRREGVKVIPLCPFANAMFKKKEDLRDVLA